MSMDNMMKQCREHCSAATKQMDDMMKKMSDARASNDSAKMRGALEDAQKPLTDMRNHMDQCMSMMNMDAEHDEKVSGDARDVVVVGAGPAGLSAALILGRCRRRALVCDDNVARVPAHFFIMRSEEHTSEL